MERFVTVTTTTFSGPGRALLLGASVLLMAGFVWAQPAVGQAVAEAPAPATSNARAEAEKALLSKTNEATQALINGQLDTALGLFDEIIATNAQLPRIMAAAHYHRGIIHQKRGAFNEAAADYTTALWLDELPDNMRARAHYNRGTALDNIGQQEKAKQDFDIAISLAPDMSAAYNNRANVLRRMGQLDAAIADYDKSIELGNPLPHLPHYGRGTAREALGNTEGAREDFTKALSLAPDYRPAKAALAALPEPPSALQMAAAPQAVTPASSAQVDLADLPPVEVEVVETSMLPPPPQVEENATVAATSQTQATAQPASQPVQQWVTAQPSPPLIAAAPTAAVPDRRAAPAMPAALEEAQRTTTAAATPSIPASTTVVEPAPAEQPTVASARPAPMPMMGSWTTTILPAGSNAVLTLDDATRAADVLTAAALKTAQETQVAAMTAPQPKAGLSFPGVPTDAYREAARAPAPVTSVQPRSSLTADGSGFAVQLASFRTEAEAELAWRDASNRFSSALQDREYLIQRAEVPGKGTYYRLRVGPMAVRSTAAALCSTLKSQGQDCYVTKL